MTRLIHIPDPKLDLLLERVVDVPPELVWAAWTTPEHLMQWFTPVPWKTVECEIDLRPGGIFRTVMQSPEGQKFPGTGCYLEVITNEKLAWTNALLPAFRPAPVVVESGKDCNEIIFTAVISLEPSGSGTKYTALAMHRDEDGCKRHADMGFHDGWGTVLDQLVAYMKARDQTG
jgi:uncharacterized protein YndB with AHSA1/START domain